MSYYPQLFGIIDKPLTGRNASVLNSKSSTGDQEDKSQG